MLDNIKPLKEIIEPKANKLGISFEEILESMNDDYKLNHFIQQLDNVYYLTTLEGICKSPLFEYSKMINYLFNYFHLNMTKDEYIKAVLEIATEVQKYANANINRVARENFNIKGDHYFELKQEVVIERGYFAGKRRYAMYIVNKEGVTVDEMVMMGLDLMKSNMTPMYRKFGEELLQQIMFGTDKKEIDKRILDFKKYVKDLPITDIAKPTGVKQIQAYIERKPGTGEIFSQLRLKCPINTKAAVWYNDLLRFKKLDKKYPCFTEGDKMKYIQLKDNPYRIDVIGLTGNDPEFINLFIDKYADREQGFESSLMNKLVGIYDDLKWEFPSLHEKAGKFFKFD